MYFIICSRQWCFSQNWWKTDDDHMTHLLCVWVGRHLNDAVQNSNIRFVCTGNNWGVAWNAVYVSCDFLSFSLKRKHFFRSVVRKFLFGLGYYIVIKWCWLQWKRWTHYVVLVFLLSCCLVSSALSLLT